MTFFSSLGDFAKRGPRIGQKMSEGVAKETHTLVHQWLLRELKKNTPRGKTGDMASSWRQRGGKNPKLGRGRSKIWNIDPGAAVIAGGRRTGKSGKMLGSEQASEGLGKPEVDDARKKMEVFYRRAARKFK